MPLCPLETDRKNCQFAWQLIRWNTGFSLKLAINTFLRDRRHVNLFLTIRYRVAIWKFLWRWKGHIRRMFPLVLTRQSIRIFDFSSLALILHISQQCLFKQFKLFQFDSLMTNTKNIYWFFAYAIMNIASALIKSPGETLRERERTEKGSQRPTSSFAQEREELQTLFSHLACLFVCLDLFLLPRFSFYFFLIITCLCSPINFLLLADNELHCACQCIYCRFKHLTRFNWNVFI